MVLLSGCCNPLSEVIEQSDKITERHIDNLPVSEPSVEENEEPNNDQIIGNIKDYPIVIKGKPFNYSPIDLARSFALSLKGKGNPVINEGTLITVTGLVTEIKVHGRFEMNFRKGSIILSGVDHVTFEKIVKFIPDQPITITGYIKRIKGSHAAIELTNVKII